MKPALNERRLDGLLLGSIISTEKTPCCFADNSDFVYPNAKKSEFRIAQVELFISSFAPPRANLGANRQPKSRSTTPINRQEGNRRRRRWTFARDVENAVNPRDLRESAEFVASWTTARAS